MTITTDTQNGHVKGRAVPAEKLEPFTFEGSGRTVFVRKLSTLWRDRLRQEITREPAFKEPEPPMVELDYGDGKIRQAHRGHPLYQQMVTEWTTRVNAEVGNRILPLVIRRGVVCDVDQDAVQAAREDAVAVGMDLSEYDDHYVYVAFVCMGPFDDWNDLLKAVWTRSAPTEGAIKEATAMFPRNVPGPGLVAPVAGPATGEDELQPDV